MAIQRGTMTMDEEDDDVEVVSGKKSVFWKKVSLYFTEFTSNTSLHGFKYIGDRKRTKFERALWLILVAISIVICITLLSNTYLKWINTPIILVEDKVGRPISTIPFPAVTICPENKVKQSVYNFTESMIEWRLNKVMEEQLNISLLLCDDIGGDILQADEGNETETIDTRQFIHNISMGVETFGYCEWVSDEISCENLFIKSFTEEGVCFTFNGLSGEHVFADDVMQFNDFWNHDIPTNDWSISSGYKDPKDKDAYPKRTFASGASSGLTIYFATNKSELDFACRNLPEAFKIILHHPGELPRAEKFTSLAMTSILVEEEVDASIALTPKVITTSESLRKYHPKKRNCYYPNEKKLRYFKEYSQQKCEYECIQNATFAVCDCFAYYMPMVDDTPICRSNKLNCTQQVKALIATNGNGDENICNCLPTCSSITYSSEVSMYTYDLRRRFSALGIDISNISDLQISRVSIFFKESQYFISKRSELYGLTDFVSNCGGLFGLFVGFSLISLLEAIYFVTVRVIVNCRQYGRDRWYGSSKLIVEDERTLHETVPISIVCKE